MKQFKLWLQSIMPSMWYQQIPFDKAWDSELNRMLDNPDKWSGGDRYTLRYNGKVDVWIENYPYCYGYVYRPVEISKRPSRKTILRLRQFEAERNQKKEKEKYEQVLDLLK